MIKHMLSVIGIGLATLMSATCQEKTNSANSITYSPLFVPLPQGQWVEVGTLDLNRLSLNKEGNLTLDIRSESSFEAVRLTTRSSEKEVEILVEKEGVNEKVQLDYNSEKIGHSDKITLSVKLSADHNLRDRIEIKPISIETDGKQISIVQSREIELYRVATPLRDFGDDGVHSYRIPGLVTSTKGTLLAVYDIRRNTSRDLQGDIDVGLSRSTDGGKSWEPMKVIMDMGEHGGLPQDQNGIGDPAILVDHETGHIWVAALWLHGKPGEMAWNSSRPGMRPSETGQFVLVKSEDDGLTWSEPMIITDQIKNPEWNLFFNGPGKGITMKDGTLVFPAQFKDKDQMPHSTIIYSKDKGKTWKVGSGAKSNTTEAQVVELQDGSLMLNMRDNRGGSRSISITKDLGQTWTEHATSRSALPEPVCMASIIENPYQAGMLLFSNPATEKGRNNITIKASLNDGDSWPEDLQVLLDEGTGWGYSCLTMINEREVGILYESSVANMTFQIIPLNEILTK